MLSLNLIYGKLINIINLGYANLTGAGGSVDKIPVDFHTFFSCGGLAGGGGWWCS
jgi:hypothetical protein